MNETMWLLQHHMGLFPDRINPNVPLMEDILFCRDDLEEQRSSLSVEELNILTAIDERLRQERDAVLRLLDDPKEYRERLKIPRSHWWWYLDDEAATAEAARGCGTPSTAIPMMEEMDRLQRAVAASAGAWSDSDHPELATPGDIIAWVESSRRSEDTVPGSPD